MKRKNKGFTLIELLAVIVILGLLMAIAIPSVTKYITQSRKKTVTTTVENYIGALVNEVNDLQYTFTSYNTVYAVPIECISLERGGTDPFGEWYQANDSYWAYVLIQYDDENSKYIYGFTFKDSAGYGMYPTAQSNIKESGSQIKTGYDLKRPTTGTVENITSLANWDTKGFEVDSTTNLVVLEAESDGVAGDGKETCTLVQKGNNYWQVEEEKEIAQEEKIKNLTLMETTLSSTTAFWGYREQIKNITFEDDINIPNDVFKSWDVSSTGNGKVMAYIIPNATDSNYYDLFIQGDGKIYANSNSSWLFACFHYLDSINNISILDTSNVTNMSHLFFRTGYNATTFNIGDLSSWDTSNVTDMSYMFNQVGYNETIFNIGDLSKWDTSNVTDMSYMFHFAGFSATTFNISGLEKWDTSNVTNMASMFNQTGENATTFNIGDLSKWDTSNVTDMGWMFCQTGYKSSKFKLDCSGWNVDKVTNYTSFSYGVTSKVTHPTWVN